MRKNEAIWIEKSQRWQIKVQKDGVRRAFYSPDPRKKGKAEAERKADRWLETGSRKETARIGALAKEFAEYESAMYGTGNNRQHESIYRNWIAPKYEHKKAADMTQQDWKNIIKDAYTAGRSKKTLKNIRGYITSFCGYMEDCDVPIKYPRKLKIPDDAPEQEKNILQPSQLRTLFTEDTVTTRGKVGPCFHIYAFRFLAVSGYRPGEMCGLRKTDLKKTYLKFTNSINIYGELTAGKNERARRKLPRTTYINTLINQQLENLKAHGLEDCQWLFPDADGEPLNPKKLYKRWKKYADQHGLTCSPYELRHTFISVSKSAVPAELLKLVVGHSKSMDTFGVYGHEVDGELKQAGKLIEGVFDGILKNEVG